MEGELPAVKVVVEVRLGSGVEVVGRVDVVDDLGVVFQGDGGEDAMEAESDEGGQHQTFRGEGGEALFACFVTVTRAQPLPHPHPHSSQDGRNKPGGVNI